MVYTGLRSASEHSSVLSGDVRQRLGAQKESVAALHQSFMNLERETNASFINWTSEVIYFM
jgi:hypothetical protein